MALRESGIGGKTMQSITLTVALKIAAMLVMCCTIVSFPSLNASEHDSEIYEHLRLQALVEPSAQRQAWLTVLRQGSDAERLEYRDAIFESVRDFWQSRQVPIGLDDTSKPYDTGYSRNDTNNSIISNDKPLVDRALYSTTNTVHLSEQADLVARKLEPRNTNYLAVINHIRRMLWLDEHEDWPVIAPGGLLKVNDGHKSIAAIARRLTLLGDFHAEFSGLVYTPQLAVGVRAFQLRHGLKNDGVIGPHTLSWLNVSPFERASLQARNFVDKTHFQVQLNDSYLLVNIPAFEMVLVNHGKVVLHSKVIVGKTYRQTPVMSGLISNVVMNPTWTVPRNLLRQDVLPHVRKDGNYLSEKFFDVFDSEGGKLVKSTLEWQSLARGRFPYRVVQRPGDHNALGRYKFHFSNQSNIYLHDTPNPELFSEANRALSSGCIRVEKVQQLAHWFADNLVNDKRTWERTLRRRHHTQWFSLSQTLPLHLVYWTAWVDEGHLAQYRDDIYHLAKPASIELVNTDLVGVEAVENRTIDFVNSELSN
jgi:murein L,D-transpeptidase YcbB/YkuD